MTNEQDLLTMENVELQIWEITDERLEVATRLEACRYLLGRIGGRGVKRELSDEVGALESKIWNIARSNTASPTQLEACIFLIKWIEAKEVGVREAMNQGRGSDDMPPDPVVRWGQ